MVQHMVLWLKKKWKDIVFACLITCLFLLPYITKDFLGIEHDTFFHVSRIEQLSKALQHGQFLPAIYPYENHHYGYASPLFYSDVFLIIPAILHLCGASLAFAYKCTVFIASFISSYAMIQLAMHITNKKGISYIASCAYLFSNYRITDVYVRGALGEIFAFAFLPYMILGIYQIIYENKSWLTLTLALTALALSHNLTFLMASILCAILCIISIPHLNKQKYIHIFLSVFFAFLLSFFFTIPMIEQLRSQEFIVDYYGSNSNLAANAMDTWQYFINKTIFGYSGNTLEHAKTMTVNVGWFLTFIPLTYIFTKKKNAFVSTMLIIGYICLLLPSTFLPWDVLPLQIMQFPWRFNTLTVLLLSIPASIGIYAIWKKKYIPYIIIALLSIECIYHIIPCYARTFGMTSKTTWQDVLDGKLCDPCYSAYYVRVELAGGDYLPLNSPDFRNRSKSIKDENGNDLKLLYTTDYDTLTFNTATLQEDTTLVLPKTWYKGYTVYEVNGKKKTKVASYANEECMVTFNAEKNKTYILTYEDTPVRKISSIISGISLIILLFLNKRVK